MRFPYYAYNTNENSLHTDRLPAWTIGDLHGGVPPDVGSCLYTQSFHALVLLYCHDRFSKIHSLEFYFAVRLLLSFGAATLETGIDPTGVFSGDYPGVIGCYTRFAHPFWGFDSAGRCHAHNNSDT